MKRTLNIEENALGGSIIAYYQRDIDQVPSLINQHFLKSSGHPAFSLELVIDEMFEDRRLRWEYLVRHYLDFHWSKMVPLTEIYDQLWQHVPFRRLPAFIGLLYIPHYFEVRVDRKGFSQEDFENAYTHLGLESLLSLLEQGISDGKILCSKYDDPYGVFPVISDEYYALMDRFQPSVLYRQKLREAIDRGQKDRVNISIDIREKQNARYLSTMVMQEVFLPPANAFRRAEFLDQFHRRFPERSSLASTALRNHMDSIPSDNDLSDFIFLYTGGRVLSEDPRGWMRLFIQSIETGKVLMPLE
jgi:hypothetical protein